MTAQAPALVKTFDFRLALSFTFVAAATIYCFVFEDPYVAILVLPFFALGCARGKRPLVLAALALLPAALLVAVSYVKSLATGVPLVAYDHFFLRGNLVMLAYNDWRVSTGLALAAAVAFFYARAMLSGRGVFSAFEKTALAALVLVAGYCVYAMRTEIQIAIWEPRSH